jgi:hypothetical protein
MALTYPFLTTKIRAAVHTIHIIYLGLLPALATFVLLRRYGYPLPLLLFLGGAVAVAVYIAVVNYYTPPPPRSIAAGLFVLFDGPIWVAFSMLSKHSIPAGAVVEGFIVEGTAIWLSILILAAKFPRRRLAAIGYMLLSLAITASLVYPYFRDNLHGHPMSLSILGFGIVETFATRFSQLKRDEEGRDGRDIDPDKGVAFIIIMIVVWAAAMIAGNVLFEISSV